MKKILLLTFAIICMIACNRPQPIEMNVEDFNLKAPELLDTLVSFKGIAKHICQNSGRKVFLGPLEGDAEPVTVLINEEMCPFDKNTIGKIYTVKGYVRLTNVFDYEYLDKLTHEIAENGLEEDSHICATELQAAGVDIEKDSANIEENPKMKQIQALREAIDKNGGKPIINYHLECISYSLE